MPPCGLNKVLSILGHINAVKVITQKGIECLGLAHGKRQAGLADAVLALVCWVGGNGYDVRACLLSSVVTINCVLETLGGLTVSYTHLTLPTKRIV